MVVHGQEQFDAGEPELHWRWITAHEIGHQYWGEYVLDADSPSWLWIGLGLYADREYTRACGLGVEQQVDKMNVYTEGAWQGLDTTLALTPDQFEQVSFDWNNVVKHGKGFSIISALACCLGQETFDRVYQRCLKDFAGRHLGSSEFQAACEAESGCDLGWFFDQWVRSNRYLLYEIEDQQSQKQGDRYVSNVCVKRLGTLAMPVRVVAIFEDGSQQHRTTDRLLAENMLTFESASPLVDAQIDPDRALPMLKSLPLSQAQQ